MFSGAAVFHTPAYFTSHHLLFGSWDSWWVAFVAWVRVMWKRPVDQEETCGCEGQMPGSTVLHTVSSFVWYTACFSPPLPRERNYVGSGISPWWLVCVRHSMLCSGDRPVAMDDWRFCLMWCSALTPALCHLGCLFSAWQKEYVRCDDYSGQVPIKWQLLRYVL